MFRVSLITNSILFIALFTNPVKALPITIGEIPSDLMPPVLIAPKQNWNVSDFALSFTWQRQSFLKDEDEDENQSWSVGSYQLQVANNAQFTDLKIDVIHIAPDLDISRLEEGDAEDDEVLELMEGLRFFTETVYSPKKDLETGTWYWRVRAADKPGRPWSEPIKFNLVEPHKNKNPTRIVSPSEPIFSFDMYDSDAGAWGDEPPWSKYWGFFPDNLKPYVAFAVPHEGWGWYDSPSRKPNGEVRSFAKFIEPLTAEKIPVLIKTGGPDGDPQAYLSTTELEHLYQNNPNVLGVVTGENTWAHIDGIYNPVFRKHEVQWFNEVIRLSAQYGKYVIAGEGSYAFAWDKFFGEESPTKFDQDGDISGDYVWLNPSILRNSPDTFIPSSKSNIFWSAHQMNSAVLGASIANLVSHHGTWAEAWYWSDAGYTNGVFKDYAVSEEEADFSTMPHLMWIQTMLMGTASGSVVYHFGGESGVSENRGIYNKLLDAIVDEDGSIYRNDAGIKTGHEYPSFWDMYGNKTIGFDRYIVPYLTAIIKEDLIPSKQEVLSEIKLAIDPGPVESDKGNFICYGHYLALYQNTYGLKDLIDVDQNTEEGEIEEANTGCKYELIPNSGRYYFIPVIPHPANTFSHPGIKVIPIDKLQDSKSVKAEFDGAYDQISEGTAWVAKVGEAIFITNSNENLNLVQDYSITLNGPLTQIKGISLPHSYLMFKFDENKNSFWLQANTEHGPAYTDNRNTVLTIKWKTKPEINVFPAKALLSSQWQQDSVTLVLSHEQGSVEVTGKF